MATLTIKGVPDELYTRLKEQATRNRRSINAEAIVCLEERVGLKRRRLDVNALFREVDALRKRHRIKPMKVAEILNAKREGQK